MESPALAPHCVNEFNVGVLDGVGVGLAWLQVIRWILLVSFQDGINLLIGLPNPVVKATTFSAFIAIVTQSISTGSFIYAAVKAFHCGDAMIGALLIFVSLYEVFFRFYKSFLIAFNGDRWVDGALWVFALSCSLSISYSDQMQIVGIVGLSSVFLSEVYHAVYYNFYPKGYQQVPGDYIYRGPNIICQGLIYPVVLACIITIIVKDYNHWIPRPQSNPERFFLVTRIIFASGLFEVVKALGKKIYRFYLPESESNSDSDDSQEFWGDINVTWIGVKSSILAKQLRERYAQLDATK